MKYERILTAVCSQPWAIDQDTGQRIAAVLTSRFNGLKADPAELEAIARGAAPQARVSAGRNDRKAKTGRSYGVSVIPLHGVMVQRADWFMQVCGLLSTDQVGQLVDAAAADDSVDAIVLDIDSPGGSVFGTAELGAKVAAAGKKKPVIGVANAMAASAAYWVGTQTTELVVTPSGMVGSVGVYSLHVDRSAELEEAGLKVTLVSSTPEKVAGHEFGPLDPVGLADRQGTVDGYYRQFLSAVATGRKTSTATVQETFGKGGMVLAAEAVQRGMADKVGTLDDVLGRYGLSSADLTPVAFDELKLTAKTAPLFVPASREQLETFAGSLMASADLGDQIRGRKLRMRPAGG